ncbi:engulfment and cell motility protein 2 [Rhipicephalus microplus]|uniref:engulfment and cell motility protein 2 n=1 Tax=Rhipicephalus microplus TaxID=6941 RepID=UPI003F6ABF06
MTTYIAVADSPRLGGSLFAMASAAKPAAPVGKRAKVGVKTPCGDLLLDLDLDQPLFTIVEYVCQEVGITEPDLYAIKYDGSEVYIFDANRQDIRNGDMLQLVRMPMNRNEVIEKLSSGTPDEKAEALQALLILAADPDSAVKFIAREGHKSIVSWIEVGVYKGNLLCRAIQCLQGLIDQSLVTWDIFSNKCLSRILKETNSANGTEWNNVEVFLSALECVVTSNPAAYETVFMGMPWERYAVLMQEGSVVVMRNCIMLLNALFAQGSPGNRDALKNAISNWKIKSVVWTRLKNYGQVDSELAHALHVFQAQMLGLYERLRNARVDTADLALNGKVDILLKLAQSGLKSDDARYKQLDFKRRLSVHHTAMGLEDVRVPLKDFAKPAGRLAIENLLYFADKYNLSFTTAIQENLFSSSEHMCPLVESSILLTELLCRVFRVGEPAGDEKTFLLMYFSHECFFEEVFSVCMLLVFKTWREMKASKTSIRKVFGIVNQQIVRALKLNPHCLDINSFRTTLSSLPYSEIVKQLQRENDERKASERQSRAVNQLRDSFRAEIISLVNENRINVLCNGSRFQKYGAKGNRIKDGYVFVKLSHNLKALHYGDCNATCDDVDIEELPESIAVSDIEMINTGASCPHARKAARQIVDLAFSIVICNDGQPLNLVAPNAKVLNRWLDGLNVLMGNAANSIEARGDMGILLDMEVRLRLLETEGIHIPETPPPIPPPPSNFDFSSRFFGSL